MLSRILTSVLQRAYVCLQEILLSAVLHLLLLLPPPPPLFLLFLLLLLLLFLLLLLLAGGVVVETYEPEGRPETRLQVFTADISAGLSAVLDVAVAAQLGWDAGELVAADNDHLQGGDVSETDGEVGQVILVDEQRDELLQPAQVEQKEVT